MSAIDRLFWILDRTDGLSEDIESALAEAKAESTLHPLTVPAEPLLALRQCLAVMECGDCRNIMPYCMDCQTCDGQFHFTLNMVRGVLAKASRS